MENYKTGLEGKTGDARLVVDCPAMGTIAIEWCAECEYCQGRESLSGGKRRPDKEGVICAAPLWRPAKKIVLNPDVESKRQAAKRPGVLPPWRWKFWRR